MLKKINKYRKHNNNKDCYGKKKVGKGQLRDIMRCFTGIIISFNLTTLYECGSRLSTAPVSLLGTSHYLYLSYPTWCQSLTWPRLPAGQVVLRSASPDQCCTINKACPDDRPGHAKWDEREGYHTVPDGAWHTPSVTLPSHQLSKAFLL